MIHASDAKASDYRDVGIEGRLDEGHVDFETVVDTTKVVVVVGVVVGVEPKIVQRHTDGKANMGYHRRHDSSDRATVGVIRLRPYYVRPTWLFHGGSLHFLSGEGPPTVVARFATACRTIPGTTSKMDGCGKRST